MVRTRVAVALIIILLIGGGAFFTFSTYLTGDDYVKDFFLQQLEQGIGRKIDVHRVKLVLFPRIRLELTQVAIHDRHSEHVVLSAKKLDLVLRFLPLLRKQVVGKRLLIEEPTLTVRRDRNGHWNLLDQAAQGGEADQDAIQTIGRIFRIREATLVNGKLVVIDDSREDGSRSITFESVEASLVIQAERGLADVRVSAGHAGGKGSSVISLAGAISTVQPQALANDDSPGSSIPLQFDGTFEAANFNLREAADFMGSHPVPDQLQGVVNARSHIRAAPGVAGYDVVLSDLSASLDPLSVTGQASLSGLLTPQPTFALTVAAPPIQVSQLLKIVPAEWLHPQLPMMMKDREIDGTRPRKLHQAYRALPESIPPHSMAHYPPMLRHLPIFLLDFQPRYPLPLQGGLLRADSPSNVA